MTTSSPTLLDDLLRCESSDPTDARQGRLLAALLLLTVVASVVAIVGILLSAATGMPGDLSPLAFIVLGVVAFGLYNTNRGGRMRLAGTFYALTLLGVVVYLLIVLAAAEQLGALLVVPVIIAALFGFPWVAVVIAAGAAGLLIGVVLLDDPLYFSSEATEGTLNVGLTTGAIFLTGVLATLFAGTARGVNQRARLQTEAAIQERVDLESRLGSQTRQLRATVTVARAVAGQRDLDRLLEEAVRLISDTFNYYHVQIFIVDADGRYAVLRESTGEVGEALLARGHRLAIGSLSVIGQVTASGRSVVARDTDSDAVHRRNELLPYTRAELAIPLKVGSELIGALDLQSVEPDAFTQDEISTLEALADQLAVAIQSANLFERTQTSLREMRALSMQTTRESWRDFLAESPEGEQRAAFGPEPDTLRSQRSLIATQVLRTGEVALSTGADGTQAYFAVPIVVREQVVGVVGVEPDGPREWTRDEERLMLGIAERTALAVESARLYNQAQRAAERERLINTIAARLQRAPNLTSLLENAVSELAEALGTQTVYAEINLESPLSEEAEDYEHANPSSE
ncbi:MAG: GAF domain-containing protein [Chloroflexi bacterium]|nr:GAF domain-containing protein [Chloroflexota bacterium]